MPVRSFHGVSPLDNNVYLIYDETTRLTAIVDPTLFSEKIWKFVQDEGLVLQYILNTHGHFDHIAAVTAARDAGLDVRDEAFGFLYLNTGATA